jgi:1-acyl-sn-glycerol-3-phosphate acyltransferase
MSAQAAAQSNRFYFHIMKNRCRIIWRAFFLMLYVLITLIVVPILFMPGVNKLPQNRQLASLLYRRIYHALNIKLIITGTPSNEPALWVCNHISWLDILLLAGNHTVDFIAKSDVGKWPFIGHLVRKSGTLLINRDNKFQAYRSLPLIQQRISKGPPVIIFPEGTTTVGTTTLPFKPMFYEAAVRENAVIQPIALYYLDGDSTNQAKKLTDSVAFIDQDSIGSSLKKILQQHEIIAHLHFLPVISAHQYHRKALAKNSQKEINNILNNI